MEFAIEEGETHLAQKTDQKNVPKKSYVFNNIFSMWRRPPFFGKTIRTLHPDPTLKNSLGEIMGKLLRKTKRGGAAQGSEFIYNPEDGGPAPGPDPFRGTGAAPVGPNLQRKLGCTSTQFCLKVRSQMIVGIPSKNINMRFRAGRGSRRSKTFKNTGNSYGFEVVARRRLVQGILKKTLNEKCATSS